MRKIFLVPVFMICLFLIGCAGQPLPESVVNDIQKTYENIQSYSADIENRLDGDRFDVDQEWQLSVQKPDKYKRVVVKINDQVQEPPAIEICNGAKLYTSDGGITEPYNCENLVKQTFDVIEKLNLFSSNSYDSTAELDNGNVKVTISLVGDKSETEIGVDAESYLIERIRYKTPQAGGSVSTRTEVYKNIRLNQNFDSDEFKIP